MNINNILYKAWCFFMDSRQGEKIYWKECNDYREKHPFMLITFAPYPGRLRWRQWWIIEKIKSLKWKLKYRKIKINIPTVQQVKPTLLKSNDVSCHGMSTPESPIFTITWTKDKEVNKNGNKKS